ncbi:DUF4157 domain-containing protein [Streptomyces sp. NPDC015032]|uniref:eCIS core domain-containing protein n=1 Tax=Streptomyces sp. NPDC015032 TaxID=3364937 RepID=UPI0036F85E91
MRATDFGRTSDEKAGPRTIAPVAQCRQGLLPLQSAVGNEVVLRMLQRVGHPFVQHQHGVGCGPQATRDAGRAEAPAPVVQRSAVHDVVTGSGRPMDGLLRAEMESRFGADFSDVRLHTGAAAQRSAAAIGARAYTSGNNVVIGDGGADKHTLAHELTHVIQQRRGPVAGTENGAGLSISDPSDRFEREAEAVATEVMRAPAREAGASGLTGAPAGLGTAAAAPVQRVSDKMSRQKEKDRWKPGGGAADTPAGSGSVSLNQEKVQERMGYVCQLLYAGHLSGDAAAIMEAWLGRLKVDGLCGGWVTIHQHEPIWLEPLWEALVAWEPEGRRDTPDAKDLEQLEMLLRRGGVGNVGEEVKEVVVAISTAWNVMRRLEPEAGYLDVTDLLGDSTVAPKNYDGWESGEMKVITCKTQQAGERLTSHIISATRFDQAKGGKQYYARIETPTHHMGVRLARVENSRQVRVCETEATGIVLCTSWSEMQTALQNGCNGHSEETISLEVTISNS